MLRFSRAVKKNVFTFGASKYSRRGSPILEVPYNYLDGEFVRSSGSLDVVSPCTNTSVGICAFSGAAETDAAIASANSAFSKWSTTTARTRAVALRKLSELMIARQDDLAAILAQESGKPMAESVGEIIYSSRYVEWYAGEAERVYGDFIPDPRGGVRTTVIKQPVGVVGVITPWNFPSAMVTRSVAGALAAGCTAVVKPSELTPYSALALCQLAEEAGIPKGVLNVVVGDPSSIGKTLVNSFDVRKLSFTGSTRVGKELMRGCVDSVKRVSMELGGNAPFIVFKDADLDKAVDGVMLAKFRNAGQTCVCANRVFVHESIHDIFVEKVVAACNKLIVGDSFVDSNVTMGPVITKISQERINASVKKAVSEGATVVTGGKCLPDHPGNFYLPTVLTGCTNAMELSQNEIFGPVLPVIKFSDADDVVAMANDTRAGLAAYFYSEDYKKQWSVSSRLQYGMVGINDAAISSPVAPFGGIKESGIGRDGSKYGIESFLEIKYVLHSNL